MYVERLSERERTILNMLCEADRPMMALDIIAENKTLSQSTVQVTFRRLLGRGLIEVAEISHSGNVLSRAYVVTEKAKDEVMLYVIEEYQQFRDILSVGDYIMALIKSETDRMKQKQLIQDANELIQKALSEINDME